MCLNAVDQSKSNVIETVCSSFCNLLIQYQNILVKAWFLYVIVQAILPSPHYFVSI